MLDTHPDTIVGSESEAVEYLTREGDFDIPCSRYARSTFDAAPIAYNAAAIVADACGEPVHIRDLDYAMALVVNDSPDIDNLFS